MRSEYENGIYFKSAQSMLISDIKHQFQTSHLISQYYADNFVTMNMIGQIYPNYFHKG